MPRMFNVHFTSSFSLSPSVEENTSLIHPSFHQHHPSLTLPGGVLQGVREFQALLSIFPPRHAITLSLCPLTPSLSLSLFLSLYHPLHLSYSSVSGQE